ncbi:MAG: Gfo/Idh/MocA family protein [Flavobacteriales bacterium]
MLKVGVIGAGHLGKIHIKLLQELNQLYDLIGFYDPDKETSKSVNRKFRVKAFKSLESLIEEVDVIDIVSPTVSHYECASIAIKLNKHVFIEKPLAHSLIEAEKLTQYVREANVKFQVGHVERFNPAFICAKEYIKQPLFIETHRLSEFNPRGTDVSVVLDLMIHDIDIMLNIVNSPVKNVHASGVAIVSDTPDIANARIEFNNGCICNLTASRMSLKSMRKTRVFQKDAYISIDLLDKKSEIITLKNINSSEKIDPFAIIIDLEKGKKKKQIYFENPEVKNTNAIKEELKSFHQSIVNDNEPVVTIYDGLKALELAEQIIEKMELNLNSNRI